MMMTDDIDVLFSDEHALLNEVRRIYGLTALSLARMSDNEFPRLERTDGFGLRARIKIHRHIRAKHLERFASGILVQVDVPIDSLNISRWCASSVAVSTPKTAVSKAFMAFSIPLPL